MFQKTDLRSERQQFEKLADGTEKTITDLEHMYEL